MSEPSQGKIEEAMVVLKDFFDQRGIELDYSASLLAGMVIMHSDENKKLRAERDKLRDLARGYADALLKYYPPNWAFDMGAPQLMVDNAFKGIKTERDRLRWEAEHLEERFMELVRERNRGDILLTRSVVAYWAQRLRRAIGDSSEK